MESKKFNIEDANLNFEDFQASLDPKCLPRTPGRSVAMAANREQQVGHMTSFPPAVYPFPFNSMRSHSPFDLLANTSLFGRFGADLPKEMAALCKLFPFLSLCTDMICDIFFETQIKVNTQSRPIILIFVKQF